MKTIEQYLKDNGREYRLVIDGSTLYIHPLGKDGETFDGYVSGFNIYPKKPMDNISNYLELEKNIRDGVNEVRENLENNGFLGNK